MIQLLWHVCVVYSPYKDLYWLDQKELSSPELVVDFRRSITPCQSVCIKGRGERDCVDLQIPVGGKEQQPGVVCQHRYSVQEGTEPSLLPEIDQVLQCLHWYALSLRVHCSMLLSAGGVALQTKNFRRLDKLVKRGARPSQNCGGSADEEEVIWWWTINIPSTASWQDRGAASVRGSSRYTARLRGSGGPLSPHP